MAKKSPGYKSIYKYSNLFAMKSLQCVLIVWFGLKVAIHYSVLL